MLAGLREAKEGQRVTFNYYGGSTPGRKREVEVTEVLDDRIIGVDVERDNVRQFTFDKASGVELVEPVIEAEPAQPPTRVKHSQMHFHDARQHLHDQIDELSGEDLAEVLAQVDGHDSHAFNSETGQVAFGDHVVEPHCVMAINGGMNWINEDGTAMFVAHDMIGSSIVHNVGGESLNAEECVKKIAQHLGLTIE